MLVFNKLIIFLMNLMYYI